MGRTKPESVELPEEVMSADSHVAPTVLEVDGEERRSSVATLPTGVSPTTAPRLSGSAEIGGGWKRCCGAW